MEKRMNKEELISLIESLKIDKNEFWILCSGALVIRGMYPDAGDLDIAVTAKGLEELKQNYELTEKGKGWYIVNDKVECVLDEKEDWKIEKYGDYLLESLPKYHKYLVESDREKDKLRLPLVEAYMMEHKIMSDKFIWTSSEELKKIRRYNKLVRDKIPAVIENKGEKPITRILSDEEYLSELNKKLQEEMKEYLEDGSVEELADLVEVVYGILSAKNVSVEQFEAVRMKKVEDRGAFKDRIYLECVEE